MSRWSGPFVGDAIGLTALQVPYDFAQISTDTRTVEPGALFVALRGDRFDGHDHLAAARDAGARAAVVRQGTLPVPGLMFLEVPDPLRAYGDLARAHRRRIAGPVIAITGTNGKTSTKEMVAAILRTRYRVHATRVNLNNLVGVPLTILEAPEGTEALVVEAGANLPGEISRYREIIEPTIAVVTNVAAGHLEGFGSLEGVMREKLGLTRDVALAVVGTEPAALSVGARALARRVITAGLTYADLVPEALSIDPAGRASFVVDGRPVSLSYPGAHLAANAMLAWAVGRELGLDPAAAAAALGTVRLPGGRTEVSEIGRLIVLNDSYNANPQSFASVIATARAMRGNRRLVFVAGTMRELGTESTRLHAEVARALIELAPDLLAVTGDFVPALEPYAAALGDRLVSAADVPTLGARVRDRLLGGELVVLKASRGVALERILPFLSDPMTTAPEA